MINDIELEWAEHFGTERIVALRETLEAIAADRPAATPA